MSDALSLGEDIRNAPDEAFITRIRSKYSVEPEIDHILTRKLRRRSGPEYSAIPLNRLVEGVSSLIAANIGETFEIDNARWLSGGASKLQMAFDLEWRGHHGTGDLRRDPMVLRMEPPEAIVETSRAREFEILSLVEGVVPVPPCHWVDDDGTHLPFPALVYGFANGTTKPRARPSTQVTGIGTNFGPDLRNRLAEQFVGHLAAIHTIPAQRIAVLTSFAPAEVGSNSSVLRQIAWWRRVWDEDRIEDLPLVHVAARWLIDNAPPLDHVSVVHGDFRAGNFLFDEADGTITAWLDWELAVLGDRHQDLTWIAGTHFGHYHEDGHTFLACGLLATEELYDRYEAVSGLTVDPVRLRYYRIFNDFVSCVHMLATAGRVARGGKTHQDVVVAWLSMIGNVIAGKLRASLAETI